MSRIAIIAAAVLGTLAASWALVPFSGFGMQPAGSARESGPWVDARAEAARAGRRAEALDRQALASTRAAERATLAAAALAARVQQAEATVAVSERQLATVRQQRRELDHRLARERAPTVRLMAGLQALARRPTLLTLAQPGSATDAVHLQAVAAAVHPQVEARTSSLRQTLRQMRTLEAQGARIAARARAQGADLMARRRELDARSASERLKARRSAGAADREAERAFAIAGQSRDLPALVGRLTAQRTGAPTGTLPGLPSYRLPVSGQRSVAADGPLGRVTLVPQPSAVAVAPASGRIAFAGPFRGYGSIVIIEHAGGWTSLVTGLVRVQVVAGQGVIGGSPIGQAPQHNPQIGLELRSGSRRVDPLTQLR